MNNRGEVMIAILIAVMIGTVGLSQTKWCRGYDKSSYVEDAEPLPAGHKLYLSIPGHEDKNLWWDLSSVQERSRYLADLIGYEGDDIACSADGMTLFMGVDK